MPEPIRPKTIKPGVTDAGIFNWRTRIIWPMTNPASGPLNKIMGSVKANPNIHNKRYEFSFWSVKLHLYFEKTDNAFAFVRIFERMAVALNHWEY